VKINVVAHDVPRQLDLCSTNTTTLWW